MMNGRRKKRKLTDDDLRENYEALANAIVVQACIDYRGEKGNTQKSKMRKESVVDFFHSDFFALITSIDPDELIAYLDRGGKVDASCL